MTTRTCLALSLCIGMALLVGGLVQSPSAPRRPPFPNGRLPHEILANISSGIKDMRMDEAPGLDALGGPLVAGRILEVTSDVVADYYVVELVATNGQPLADVAISTDGRVMSVWPFQPGAPRPLAPDLNDVKTKLARRFGSAEARYYHTMTNIAVSGGSVYVPLVAADTPRGRIYVNSDLDMYVEDSFTRYTRSKEQEFEELRKAKPEHFRATKTGIGKLRKLGTL